MVSKGDFTAQELQDMVEVDLEQSLVDQSKNQFP